MSILVADVQQAAGAVASMMLFSTRVARLVVPIQATYDMEDHQV